MARDKAARWLQEARRRHRAGDPAGALALYRRCLEAWPGRPELLAAAAMAAAQAGRLEEAEVHARASQRHAPDARGAVLLGRVLLQRGAAGEAAQWFRRATGDPRLGADAAFHLGQALRQAGAPEEAERALRDAVGLNPGHGPAWNELGVVQAALRRPGEAADSFGRSLEARPGHPATVLNLVSALTDAGRLDEAAGIAGREAPADPGLRWRLAMARLDRARGRLTEAREAYRDATRAFPGEADAWAGLAACEQALGRLGAAGGSYARALELAPGQVEARAGRAECLEWQGRYEDGLASLGEAGDADPPQLQLVRARLLRRLGRLDEAAGCLDRARARAGADALLCRQIAFTRGEVEDARGRHDLAFAAWEEGNALAYGEYDGHAHGRWLERLEALAPAPRDSGPGEGVIFILGMPRSGTTLVEQILAAHPAVTAGGELPALGELVHEAAAATPGALPPDALAALGEAYLRALPARPAPGRPVTDKMPLNYLYTAVILAALPGARIVHCLRDPRDVAVSCFATDFMDPSLAFSRRLDWLADYLRRYQGLMARHEGQPQMRALRYETLVAGPEAVIRDLLAFCGLEWDPACVGFHASGRPAATASHAQVREPVYTRSVGRWRHYRRHLGPVLDAWPPAD